MDLSYPPRAMKVERAVAYLDMSRSKFLELVEAQRFAKAQNHRWHSGDRIALDSAFDDFPNRGDGDNPARRNSFDDVLRG